MNVLRSALLTEHGFSHAFSLRTGGVSEGPYASLNLARTIGDVPAHVTENAARFAEALGTSAIYEVSQVHGRRVVEVAAADEVMEVRRREADALVARTPGRAVAVRTADCVPILLGHIGSGDVAAVHAGWRGVVARIAEAAIERLGQPSELVAAIGPHIRLEAFEVSAEVAGQIAEVAHGEPVVEEREPRPHADLGAVLIAQLRALGVVRIDDVGGCTHQHAERFFSHRRDQGQTGRHLSAIIAGW